MPTGQTAWQAAGPRADARARGIVATTTALGAFTVSNAGNPLPVELLHFTAERRGPDALLRWATVSEKNNDRFEVESSPDGRAFRRVATVFSKNGNSPQRQDYTLTDPNLTRYAADVIYYRLRQVDRDGTAQYSPVRTVAAPAENGFAAQAYPQPFATELTLLIRTDEAGPVIMRLHDAVGRALLTRTAALQPGAASVPLPAVAALPPGVYVLSITQNKYHRTVKVVRE
jgi:hypothetical protein